MKNNKYNFPLIILDVLIIVVSLVAAWMIRSRFKEFFYTIEGLMFIMPYVILTRILVNMFLEGYSYYYNAFQREMVIKIFKINLYSSMLFLFLRLFSPIQEIRMPLAIIFTEYMVTSAGMMFVRYFFYRNISSSDKKIIPEMCVYCSDFSIKEKKILQNVLNWNDVKISAVYTDTVTDIDSSFQGIPIINSEINNENIIIIGNPDFEEKMIVLNNAEKSGNNVFSIENDKYIRKYSISDLFVNRIDEAEALPLDVAAGLEMSKISYYGIECFEKYLKELSYIEGKSVFKDIGNENYSIDSRFIYYSSISPGEDFTDEIIRFIKNNMDNNLLLLLPVRYSDKIEKIDSGKNNIVFTGLPVLIETKLNNENYYDTAEQIVNNSLKIFYLIINNSKEGCRFFIKSSINSEYLNFANNFVNKGFLKNLEQLSFFNTENLKTRKTVFNNIYELEE